MGLFAYIILPVFLVIGLLLIPIGMLLNAKKIKRKHFEQDRKWPLIDLNKNSHRNALIIFSVGSLLFLFFTGMGSYEAFHYTESTRFCGTLCHQVMEPEFVAYKKSPHARVSCVECHVGAGADWFVRSKMSGLYQVYAVLADVYPRPIPTPITSLRPARETCEECHWPQKFYSRQLRNFRHYLSDSINTEWNITLQMKIGPSNSALGFTEGMHWHINPDVKIDYIAKKEDLNEIPWVRYSNIKTGEERLYQPKRRRLKEKEIEGAVVHEMDCMDCHNRPSHRFDTPQDFIDKGFASNELNKGIPYLKQMSMEVLKESYPSSDTARMEIEAGLLALYKEQYPEVYMEFKEEILKEIPVIIAHYEGNIFPQMKASWDVYTDRIGHVEYPGCFRCHNGTHATEEGRVISNDCNLCHTIVGQGTKNDLQLTRIDEFLEFKHPKDIEGAWLDGDCAVCHRYLYD